MNLLTTDRTLALEPALAVITRSIPAMPIPPAPKAGSFP